MERSLGFFDEDGSWSIPEIAEGLGLTEELVKEHLVEGRKWLAVAANIQDNDLRKQEEERRKVIECFIGKNDLALTLAEVGKKLGIHRQAVDLHIEEVLMLLVSRKK